jgi:lambda repressor-like predicted transcriptional regulator
MTSPHMGAGLMPGVVTVSDAYFSLKALSSYAGLSVRRLRSWLNDRRWPLPYYRIGGKILVRRSDYDVWAARFRRDAAAVDALVDDVMQGLQ